MRIAITANLKKGITASASPDSSSSHCEAAEQPKQSAQIAEPVPRPEIASATSWPRNDKSELWEGEAEEEFDSPETVESIQRVFQGAGHKAFYLPADATLLGKLLGRHCEEAEGRRSNLATTEIASAASQPRNDGVFPIDFIFNIAEGLSGRSREAHVPALAEMKGIPYSGSDPLALALTLDKSLAKFASLGAGVPTPDFAVLRGDNLEEALKLPFPLFVKPAWEGSSKGIRFSSKVGGKEGLEAEVLRLQKSFPGQPILVEKYLAGREFTVGILGNDPPRVLGVMEVKSRTGKKDFVYSLETKRHFRSEILYECPPKNLAKEKKEEMESLALKLFGVFGCRDFARFDFRADGEGIPYFLEANPLPGLNPESGDFVIMATLQGWKYEDLILEILEAALRRYA